MPNNPTHNESPTLPLPPPRSATITLDHFFEAASAAALRSLDAHVQQVSGPQPEPWRVNPRIWVGIIIEHQFPQQIPNELGRGGIET